MKDNIQKVVNLNVFICEMSTTLTHLKNGYIYT